MFDEDKCIPFEENCIQSCDGNWMQCQVLEPKSEPPLQGFCDDSLDFWDTVTDPIVDPLAIKEEPFDAPNVPFDNQNTCETEGKCGNFGDEVTVESETGTPVVCLGEVRDIQGLNLVSTHFTFTNFSNVVNIYKSWFTCGNQKCSLLFESIKLLNEHNKLIHGNENFLCDQCGKTFTSSGRLNGHKKMVHDRSAKLYNCNVCGKCFLYPSKLKEHEVIHTTEKLFKCDKCGKCCVHRGNFRKHLLIHIEKQFRCETCGKAFRDRANLNAHIRIHTKKDLLCCETCFKTFTSLRSLKGHKKMAHGYSARPCNGCTCGVCGKWFFYRSKLKEHEAIHATKKIFKCDKCGKCSVRLGDFQKHLLIHIEKQFRCETCGKAFRYRSDFNAHSRIHTKKDLLHCETCFKTFTSLGRLNSHKKMVHKHKRRVISV